MPENESVEPDPIRTIAEKIEAGMPDHFAAAAEEAERSPSAVAGNEKALGVFLHILVTALLPDE